MGRADRGGSGVTMSGQMRLALPAQIVLALSLRCQSSTRAANGGAPAHAANDIAPAASASAPSQKPSSPREALIARAKSLELDTPYVPPPGDPLSHHAAGFAKVMCSAVFITGLDPDFATENIGYFTAPYEER